MRPHVVLGEDVALPLGDRHDGGLVVQQAHGVEGLLDRDDALHDWLAPTLYFWM
jgi:hypothetical protein